MKNNEIHNKVDENILAQVVDLANMVDYQEGSVVSRTIVEKNTGTITLFAFDKGQGLSEHSAPFDALVYILEGKTVITISGKAFNLKGGEILIMPADKPHALDALERFKMMLVMIKS